MLNIYVNVALCRDSSGNNTLLNTNLMTNGVIWRPNPNLGSNTSSFTEEYTFLKLMNTFFTLLLSFSQLADVHIGNKHIHSTLKIQISPPPRTIATHPYQLVRIWMLCSRSSLTCIELEHFQWSESTVCCQNFHLNLCLLIWMATHEGNPTF